MTDSSVRYVGLDVHKRLVEACLVDQAGQVVHRERFALNRRTLELFATKVLRPGDQVALEATTNCWAVADGLRPHVERVVVSNPMATKAIAQAKVKTDKVDTRSPAPPRRSSLGCASRRRVSGAGVARPRGPRARRSCPAAVARSRRWSRCAAAKAWRHPSRWRRANSALLSSPVAHSMSARSVLRRWCRGVPADREHQAYRRTAEVIARKQFSLWPSSADAAACSADIHTRSADRRSCRCRLAV